MGIVEKGRGLGKTIGWPTANLKIDEEYKIRPSKGVYLIQCIIDNKLFFGMMNYGRRPTLKGRENTIEIHFFSLNKDLYDLKLGIEIIEKIRSEKKFDSLESLKKQLFLDQKQCQKLLMVKQKINF